MVPIIQNNEINLSELENSNELNIVFSNKQLLYKNKICISDGRDVSVIILDYAKQETEFDLVVELGKNSSFNMRVACAQVSDKAKNYNIEVIHKGDNATSFISANGYNASNSKLYFRPVATILNGVKKSTTRVEGRIINSNDEAKSTILPVLNIADNDVIQASHGAALGSIDQNELFYLMTRGLSKKEAESLLIASYFKPVLNKFSSSNQEEFEKILF